MPATVERTTDKKLRSSSFGYGDGHGESAPPIQSGHGCYLGHLLHIVQGAKFRVADVNVTNRFKILTKWASRAQFLKYFRRTIYDILHAMVFLD